ncbi:MAG: cytochrome bc complex cytochrome b subunit [Planctomycetes bacterium]|nr:cytochrome bc complex cytochrome b subunit [Planctomycetota bacterium]
MPGHVLHWVDERTGLDRLRAAMRHKLVPVHRHSRWYYCGGLALLFLLVQFLTGILLTVYYRPGPQAHASVQRIVQDIPSGRWVHSVHVLAADGMIACLLLHLASTFFMRAYRRPRELTWLCGLALLAVTLTAGFSGYLLPLNERSYAATQVGLRLLAEVPAAGRPLADALLGGAEMSEETVHRFFALHTLILPNLMILLVLVHLALVQAHGLSTPPGQASPPGGHGRFLAYWPDFARRETLVWVTALSLLLVAAAFYTPDLGAPADPLKPTPLGIRPEWYFMPAFQMLRLLGRWLPGAGSEVVGMVAFGMAALGGVLVPFLDGGSDRPRRARMIRWLGVAFLAVATLLAGWGYLSSLAQVN